MIRNLPFTIASLHQAYAGGLTVEDVIAESFRRIAAIDDPGIFLHLPEPAAVAAGAGALGAFDPVAKPLWGVPFAIKDNINAAGWPTTAACPDFTYMAEADAFAVQALRDAGAVLIGKTNLDQFATGLVGVRTPYPVPKNAVDPAIVPGGSSSGSAVAVAHGIVSFALGTDTAGSGRVPAALNNIVGIKPSLGAISNTGVVPACLSLDTISIFALSVEDAYRAYRCTAKFNPADSYARRFSLPEPGQVPPKCRVGVPDMATRAFFGDKLQEASYEGALAELADMGAEIVEIDFTPLYDVARMLYGGVWVAERYSVIEDLLKENPDAVYPVTRRVIEVAEQFSAADTFRSFYKLQDLKRELEPVLGGLDLLCVPTIPTFYSVDDLAADPIGPNSNLGTYTNFVNLMDMCGVVVPLAPRDDGRPGSITLLAAAGRDPMICALASELHQRSGVSLGATGWALEKAAPTTAAPASDEIALAVVGAHMSGLALNHELTRLGAHFLKSAKTTQDYRLFSLPGGPPVRPGLVNTGNGAAIDLEVWAIPTARFGEFIQGVPRPLGIGTLRLDDGTEVKGFLCEQLATDGAEDVTPFGGWRSYLDHQSSKQQPAKESNHA